MFHALIVGINRYADSKIRDLDFARADAEALASLLEERVEGKRSVTLLVDERATKARIARAMNDDLPRNVMPTDEVLVYFAGHGSPEVDPSCGEPSIHAVTHDTEYARLSETAINMVSELSGWVRRLTARHVAVILDTSFNGGAGGRTFEGPGLWSGPRTRRLDRVSLKRLALGSQAAMLTACSEKEAAKEERSHGHGVFTHHLLDALRSSAPRSFSLSSIHHLVAGVVREETQGEQNPALHPARSNQPLFRLESTLASV